MIELIEAMIEELRNLELRLRFKTEKDGLTKEAIRRINKARYALLSVEPYLEEIDQI